MAFIDYVAGGAIIGIAAYLTNAMGFKTWADQNLFQLPPGGGGGFGGGGIGELPPVEGGVGVPIEGGGSGGGGGTTPKPATFKCVSYPRCDSVSGTDARKKCCCTNKCSALGRTFKSMDYGKGICYCNPKPTPKPPTKCYGPCRQGQYPKLINGRCSCATCTACKLGYRRGSSGCSCVYNCSCKCGIKNLTVGGCTCKTCPAPTYGCTYSGCTGLPKGSTCDFCHCSKQCAAIRSRYPGKTAHPTVSGGNCYCNFRASLAKVLRARAYPYEPEMTNAYSAEEYLYQTERNIIQVPTLA